MTTADDNLPPIEDERDERGGAGLCVLGALAIAVALIWLFSDLWG